MVGVRDWNKISARAGFAVALLALAALLAACAAPTGSSGQASGAQAVAPATSAPVATTAPAATVVTAATQAPAATEAPAATAAPAATEAPAAAAATVSFSKDVMPIFQATCIKCHGGSDGTKGDLSLKTYEDMMKGGQDGAVIDPGSAATSLLVKQIQSGKMPKRGSKLPQAQIDLIAKWVTEGAKNN